MTRRKRSNSSNENNNSGDWLTTYSDLVTLLLAFFVLLFSISEVDAEKFRSIMSSFQGGTGVFENDKPIEPMPELPEIPETDFENDDDLDSLKIYLDEYIDSLGLGNMINVEIEERGIIIRFMDKVFFDSGSATIKGESYNILEAVAEILNKEEFVNRQIKVEGHTDSDRIIRNNRFPTNWELSSARATNVLRYLVEFADIDGERVSSSGYSYYRNIAPNDTDENKAKNRRVDIIILRDFFQDLEP